MPFAQGSRSRLSYVPEVTFGETPVTPSMIQIPFNTHSVGLKKTIIPSNAITGDRQVRVSRHGNKTVSGDMVVEFCADDYDYFLECAFFGTFTTGVLKLGTTFKSFTLEDALLDLTKFRVFRGCAVNTLNIEVKPDAMVMASFGIVGKDSPAVSGTPLDAAVTAPTNNAPFDSFSGTIEEDGSAIATVTSLTCTIENGLNPTAVIGSDVAPQLEYGRGKVTGEMTCYFDSETLYNKFVNETETDLVFSLTDGLTGNTYTFNMPKVKINGGDMPVQNEQSRLVTIPFEALYNSSDATAFFVTKS